MKKEQQNKPFTFCPSPDAVQQFKDASPEAKLNWLEEANRFVQDFVPREKLERWRKISGR
jgi:hypothetical protein